MAQYQTDCQQCGKPYIALTKQSKFCSDKCRVAAYRRRNDDRDFISVDIEIRRIESALNRLTQASDKKLHNHARIIGKALAPLKDIRDRIQSYQGDA